MRPQALYITLFVTDAFFDRVLHELARSFETLDEACIHKVRVISLGNDPALTTEVVDEGFERACKKLFAGEALQCAKTGKVHALRTLIIKFNIPQFFAVNPITAISRVGGKSVHIFAWFSGMTTAAFMVIAPEKYGGPGNVREKAEAQVKKTGIPFEDAVHDILFTPKGKIHHFPGLPPMYDYELYPQDSAHTSRFAAQTFPRMHETLDLCQGIFFNSPASYESEAFEQARMWLGETGRSAYACGPLVPHTSIAKLNEVGQTMKGAEIMKFLDTTLRKAGEKSLLYISFGSMYWPGSPETLWAFLDIVMELHIPFLLSHAAPRAAILPDEFVQKVQAYGKGFLSPWAPQQTILEHPATGWFLTHGGHNSVVESISAGVPMIAWPFHADQPLNAVRISEVLGIGYELIEVRTGHGLHPLHRNGRKPVGTIDALKAEANDVLRKAFGDDGAQKREKVLALKQSFDQEWEEGGTAWKDIHAFLDSL
ncbi:hypothetical protein BN946_scf184994.g10 [Trametes cinnabarina]|uniref:Glycosyltransferase Family 1 protein n=1 Tax=Pycnoporus cinnabarinus TaxID=5643 RepID=A0A060SE49_PYCCI|nr:hypothetical protein BN946_scf184994.g10 [Trametes cinnabarina]